MNKYFESTAKEVLPSQGITNDLYPEVKILLEQLIKDSTVYVNCVEDHVRGNVHFYIPTWIFPTSLQEVLKRICEEVNFVKNLRFSYTKRDGYWFISNRYFHAEDKDLVRCFKAILLKAKEQILKEEIELTEQQSAINILQSKLK